MSARKPHDTATTATAEQGEVMLDGPDGMALSFTPEAARRSARSIDAAEQAERQVRPRRRPPKRPDSA